MTFREKNGLAPSFADFNHWRVFENCYDDIITDLINVEDRLGEWPVLGVGGEGVAGEDLAPVLPHHELGRGQHVGDETLQLQSTARVNIQVRSTNYVNLSMENIIRL